MSEQHDQHVRIWRCHLRLRELIAASLIVEYGV
jgi:hypothetical protein